MAEKIAFYRNVITNMTGNAAFPTPGTSLTEAATTVDYLESCATAARDGSRTAVATMHAVELTADTIFRKLGTYVEQVAAGDESKILSSGFKPSRQPISIQKPELTVENGANSGSVRLVARSVAKAGAYIWQMAKDTQPLTDAGWSVTATTTRTTHEVSGLNPSTRCYFRVAAVTPDGTSDFTSAVMKVVI